MNNLPHYESSSIGPFHWIAVPASIFFHVALAWFVLQVPQQIEKKEDIWMEMTVVEAPSEPPPKPEIKPEPEPEPEPEPPKPEPKKIDFEDIPTEVIEELEPPPTKKKVQRVQGMSASSFAEGGNTGLTVRAGTTLRTSAGDTISIDEAKESTAISYAAATKQPRLKKRPPLEIPPSVIEEGIEGTVKIVIDINEQGIVIASKITKSLSPEADKACLVSWESAKFQPARQGDDAVSITNFPRRCRFKALD